MSVSVVDSRGEILGVVRTRDAPVFGIDVSLQKARTAAFLSSASAATALQALPDARYLSTTDAAVSVARSIAIAGYVTDARAFLADSAALGDGRIAYSARALGNLARPTFPDGIDDESAGPFGKTIDEWSPFSTGLQLDTALNAILQHVLFVSGAIPTDVVPGCAGVSRAVYTGWPESVDVRCLDSSRRNRDSQCARAQGNELPREPVDVDGLRAANDLLHRATRQGFRDLRARRVATLTLRLQVRLRSRGGACPRGRSDPLRVLGQ